MSNILNIDTIIRDTFIDMFKQNPDGYQRLLDCLSSKKACSEAALLKIIVDNYGDTAQNGSVMVDYYKNYKRIIKQGIMENNDFIQMLNNT